MNKPSVKQWQEPAPDTDFDAFVTVVESRRSVRKFEPEPIPDEIVERCLDLALLAPTSSNLQSWEFYRVVDPDKKQRLAEACLSQPAATTAAELIVAVARTDTWREHSRKMVEVFDQSEWEWPKTMRAYYEMMTRIAYGLGPARLGGAVKAVVEPVVSLFRAAPTLPKDECDLKIWAVKTTALACENLMLAFRAAGYDSCPMEGFDERRIRKLLKLPKDAVVVMVVGAGKRAPGGVYGPRIRFERDRFIHTV
ncbi:MAG: nitroreductase family protein [Candidatus Dadabacteria bacterium]|nr:MAG: nitroreductase family protein [Candidatus Dadabacteria bacterium]